MEYVKLGEIGKIVTGNTPSKKEKKYYSENYIDFVKPTNFKNNEITYINKGEEFLSLEGMQEGRVAGSNSVLITCIGNIGNIGLLNKKVCFNQQINSIEVDSSKVFKEYVAYALQSIVPVLRHNANKAVVPILNKSQLEKIKIPICNLEKQKKVIDKLNIVRIIIKRREEQLKLLEELKKSLFYEMFGDPIRNEKGWEKFKWNEVLEIITGKNQKKVEEENGEFAILGSGGEIGRANSWRVREKSVMIGRKGSINKPLLIKEKVWNVDTVFGLEPYCKKLNENYLFYFCNFFNFNKLNKAVTIPSLTKKDLLEIKMSLPPLELQNKFAEKVEKIDKLKFTEISSNKSCILLRKTVK